MKLEKIGSATTHEFDDGNIAYNIKLYAKSLNELKHEPTESNYGKIQLSIVHDGDKLKIVPNTYFTDEKTPVKGSIMNFSINEDKLESLQNSNGYIDITAAPKNEQKNPKVSEFSLYQKSEGAINYVGNGFSFADRNVGIAYHDHSGNGQNFYNCSINKNNVLSLEKEGKIYLNVAPLNEQDRFAIYHSDSKQDPKAQFSISLDPKKINLIEPDEKGNIRISFSYKKEQSIGKDQADLNVWENKFDKNTPKGEQKEKEKFYVGKGWSAENMYWNKDQTDQKDKNNSFKKDDVVEFQIDNDFYLNKNFGLIQHTVYGTVFSTDKNTVNITSPCGNFSLDANNLKPSSKQKLENFSTIYDNLKEKQKSNQQNKEEESSKKKDQKTHSNKEQDSSKIKKPQSQGLEIS